jgi:tRNA-dihydrouridine synthase B
LFENLQLGNLEIKHLIFAAPLAGVTDAPFRKILREISPDFPILTEMNSCHSLIQNARAKRNADDYNQEGLIGAQIFGADPKIMRDGAKILESRGASFIDINMGCPVPKVATKANAGAHLMRDHKLAGEIILAVANAVSIPVTIKTRLGWDNSSLNALDLVKIAAESGAKMATIHGRTRAQLYSGEADMQAIAEIKRQSLIPIIANGDIRGRADAERAVEISGANGVMIGRGLMGNPWVLNEIAGLPVARNLREIVQKHFEYSLSYYGMPNGLFMFRKFLSWYSAGIPGSAEFRRVVNGLETVPDVRRAIDDFFLY